MPTIASLSKHYLNSILGIFGIQLVRLSLSAEMENNARLVGAVGAAEVFSSFLKLSDATSMQSDELHELIAFYAQNWSLSRSQWSQDIFVMFVSDLKKGGRYLEIGGADGVTHSNTYSLRNSLSWSGVLVEPDPDMFAALKAVRGEPDVVYCAAISPSGEDGNARLRRVGQLSALVGHEGEDMHMKTRLASQDTINVTTLDLTELIKSIGELDYFSLDVEGAELQILRSIRWDNISKPKILTIEHNFRDDDAAEMRQILFEQGYREMFSEYDWLRRGDLWMVLSNSTTSP